MSNVIRFPNTTTDVTMASGTNARGRTVRDGLVRGLWLVVVLAWPLGRWVIGLDVAYQFVRMLWYWDEAGVHAGWTFVVHFAVLVALTYFVSIFKPKGL